MKPKKIIITLIFLFVISGLFVWGYAKKGGTASSVQGTPGSNLSKSGLTASEIVYDFGTISMAEGDVEKIFSITNSTGKDIILKKVTTSCMCTKAFVKKEGLEKGPFGMSSMGYVPPANELIKSGETVDVRVVYNPAAHGPAGVGPIDRFVYLVDSEGGSIQLEIKALVKP